MIKTKLVRNVDGTYGVKIRTYWFFWRSFKTRDVELSILPTSLYTHEVFSGTAMEAIEHMVKIENNQQHNGVH